MPPVTILCDTPRTADTARRRALSGPEESIILKAVVALAVCPGAAGLAYAEVTQISIKLRPWGSSGAWSDALTLQSLNLTDPIELEVGAFYSRASGYGMGASVHNIVGSPYSAADGDAAILLDRTSGVLHPDGRVGNFNFGSQAQAVYHTGSAGVDATRFRIAAPGNPDDSIFGGISVNQNSPVALGSNFDASNPAFGYHFKLSLACYNGGAARTVTIDAPKSRTVAFTTYATSTSTSKSQALSSLVDSDPASVTVSWIPAPASLGLFGLGTALAVGRRRRRSMPTQSTHQ